MSNKTIALAAALAAFIVGNAVAASLSLDGEWKLSYRNQLMLMRPDKKLYQVIADPTGRWHFYLARHSSDEHGGIIVRTEVEPDKGWRIFFCCASGCAQVQHAGNAGRH